MTKIYTKNQLLKRLKEEGLTHSYANFILKYEREGRLTLRRNPLTGYREVTDQEIDQILEAVKKDGGNFQWHAKD